MNELMITDQKEVDKLSMTIRELMPGGSKLTVVEAKSLAQVALLHGLDPFNGEVWYLKYDDGRSIGIMAGIKGHRRAAHRQLDHEGGGNFWCEFDLLSQADKKDMQIPDNAIAYRCRLFDSVSIRLYTEIIERLCKAGIPWSDVKSIAGDRPLSTGYGYFTPGEKSKMKPSACAMKRSEADALRRRFDLPFGSAVGVNGDADSVDAEYSVGEPIEESSADVQAKIQSGKKAAKKLNGDQGDIDLGPSLTDLDTQYNDDHTGGNGKTTDRPAPWSTQVITWAEQKWGIKSYQVVGALNKSTTIKPSDPDTVLQEWLTDYRTARETNDSDPSARIADEKRGIALAADTVK